MLGCINYELCVNGVKYGTLCSTGGTWNNWGNPNPWRALNPTLGFEDDQGLKRRLVDFVKEDTKLAESR